MFAPVRLRTAEKRRLRFQFGVRVRQSTGTAGRLRGGNRPGVV